jgi:hypothetical protein
MNQNRAKVEDAKIETERRRKYQGSAKVTLESINILPSPHRKRVDQLKRIFEREGCKPEYVVNHVLLLIDKETLERALEESRITQRTLLARGGTLYPELRLPRGRKLTCLHGNHRLQAGKEYLSPRNKWWVADLYLAGECG